MPELLRYAAKKEFEAWRVENVICHLLQHSLPIPRERIRDCYPGDINALVKELYSYLKCSVVAVFHGPEMIEGML